MTHLRVQEQLERLESGRAAETSGRDEAASGSNTNGIAAAALVYYSRLGHLASCAADLRCAATRLGKVALHT